MTENQKEISAGGIMVVFLILANVITIKNAYLLHQDWYWLLLLTIPLQLIALKAHRRKMS
jgi:hypothetical protein